MKTITSNRKRLSISSAEERVLRSLAEDGFTSPLSRVVEGKGRYKRFTLPRYPQEERLGITVVERGAPLRDRNARQELIDLGATIPLQRPGQAARDSRIERFFREHPRHTKCVVGDPRRVNFILKRLSRPDPFEKGESE